MARHKATIELIKKGSVAIKLDETGPRPPLQMPAWGAMLPDRDIDAILSYFLTLQPWEEEDAMEDGDEPGWDDEEEPDWGDEEEPIFDDDEEPDWGDEEEPIFDDDEEPDWGDEEEQAVDKTEDPL